MKKITFLSLLLLASTMLSAQLKITNNQTVMLENAGKRGLFSSYFSARLYAGFDGEFHYFVLNNKDIFKIDSDLKQSSNLTLDEKFNEFVMFNFASPDGVGFVTLDYDKKANEIVIYKMNIGSGSHLSKQQVKTIELDKGDEYYPLVTVSNDKSKKVLGLSIVSKKGEYKFTKLFVFDNKANIVWEEEVSPKFKNESFSISDLALSNNGIVYLMVTSFSTEKKRKINFKYEFVKVTEDGIDETNSEIIPMSEIKDVAIKILKNGNLFVGGYYFDRSKKQEVLKSFSYIFDGKSLEKLSDDNSADFSKIIPQGTKPNLVYSFYPYNVVVSDVFEHQDGSVTMFAEERYFVKYYQNGGLYKVDYQYRNVFISTFSADGQAQDQAILYKSQYVKSTSELSPYKLPLSYDVLNIDDKLYLIYNESVKADISKNLPVKKLWDIGKNEDKTTTLVCEIENGKIGKKQVLVNSQQEGRYYVKVITENANEAVIYTQSEDVLTGKIMLEKITW
ncbi:MAG: hypothetical protein LBV75_01050 [Paludibacter sp.]|jgi:hypothetical protein|nr:hypothetical protein [Paludibacter sp.]